MSRNEARARDGDYRIEVADFGPIVRASVDVRPLTVFAGPSNTGKSYLAMLVYALHRCFGTPYRPGFHPQGPTNWFADASVNPLPNEENLAARVAEWWSSGGKEQRRPLPDELASATRTALEDLAGAEERLAGDVTRCFGVDDLGDLVRRGSAEERSTVTIRIRASVDDRQTRYTFEFGRGPARLLGHVPVLPATTGIPDDERGEPSLLHRFLDAMRDSVLGPLMRNAHYLPADRSGVMHSRQVVVSTLIQGATGPSRSTSEPMLSGVRADFLNDLIAMGQRTRKAPDGMARRLETNLLAGAIRLKRSETGFPSFAYRPTDWDADLPLMRTSSMVSELAPVVLYLRYLVRPNDVLIIEEPESHLHPAMQAAFARELARLVRSGVRVMLTTHSEWILEALANLVRLSELPENTREGIAGYDVALSSAEVGAWMFTPAHDGSGSTVEEVVLDTEAGSFPAGFGEITESLYNDWARIANLLEAVRTGVE